MKRIFFGALVLMISLITVPSSKVSADSTCDCGCWMANTCGDITWEPCPGPSGKFSDKDNKDERKLCKRAMKRQRLEGK